MSLIKCSECGREISDKAGSCPHCGCPININPISDNTNSIPTVINNPVEETLNSNVLESTVSVPTNNEKPKKNSIKFIICGVIVIVIIAIIAIVKNTFVTMPDLYNVNEETASSILTNNSLIPSVIYEYDNYVEKGKVSRTSPYAGATLYKNEIVTIYISKGPQSIISKNSVIEWYSIDYNKKDDWTFESPYIVDDKLYIKCTPIFKTSFSWKADGFGEASIVDTFSKKVPIKINYDNQNVKSGVKQNIELVIPVSDLDVQRPTTLYLHLVIMRNKVQEEISVNFSITW